MLRDIAKAKIEKVIIEQFSSSEHDSLNWETPLKEIYPDFILLKNFQKLEQALSSEFDISLNIISQLSIANATSKDLLEIIIPQLDKES